MKKRYRSPVRSWLIISVCAVLAFSYWAAVAPTTSGGDGVVLGIFLTALCGLCAWRSGLAYVEPTPQALVVRNTFRRYRCAWGDALEFGSRSMTVFQPATIELRIRSGEPIPVASLALENALFFPRARRTRSIIEHLNQLIAEQGQIAK